MREETLYPANMVQDSVESLFAAHGPQRPMVYWLLLSGVMGALIALPLVKVDVSVRASGWVRPETERADLRPAVSGHIAQVLARDNEHVHAGQPLLTLNARDVEERLARNRVLQAERAALVSDLSGLTTDRVGVEEGRGSTASGLKFQTTALLAEHAQFRAQLESYRLAETKARSELARYTTLAAKGIASQQELDNARYEVERLQAESKLVVEQAIAKWEARLRDERAARTDLESEEKRLREELAQYTLRAPAGGVLIGFTGLSAGGFVAAGQILGAVSPEDALRVETFVSPKDVGLIRAQQAVRLQIDAYPYTQWGTLDGTVTAISGDLAPSAAPAAGGQGQAPVFKVLIRPAADHLALPNGVRGELKKGLTLSARFLVARRSLLQVLYEDVSSWLDPQASPTT